MAYITFQPNDYFNTKIYTGTGAENAISDIGFNPDWVWFKKRSASEHHFVYDQVRGALKKIAPSNTNAQGTETQTLKSFGSGGYTLGTSAEVNGNGVTYVSWNWKANGQGSSNTDGSINTTYTSVNTTAGFSIVQWTGNGSDGATIGHGLGVVPEMVIIKSTSNAENWNVYHKDITSADNGNLYLNSNSAYGNSGGNRWARSSISSSVFGLGSDGTTNGNGQTYIAYCFHSVKGFSKMGSYKGNGNADGAFVYTGFKPAFVMIKYVAPTGGVGDWNMYDSKRLGYNGGDAALFANLTNSEASDYGRIDFLSNGFKLRTTNSQLNELGSGSSYVYMAFAEEPLVSSNELPATAR